MNLPREHRNAWLDPATPAETLKSFLIPHPAEQMRGYEDAVSNARNEGAELIRPAAATLNVSLGRLGTATPQRSTPNVQ